MLPSLGGVDGGAGALADERYRAHRAVARLLALIAEPQPLVVILDDLHWSDGASLELIAALVRRSPTGPVLLALGFRPGPAAQRLAGPLTAPTVTRLDLAQLGPDEARQLLDGLDPAAVAAAYSHGGGNPFYLEQLGRAAQEGGLATTDVGGEGNGGVPPAVAGAIAGELAALADAPRRLLEAAAVAGEPFEPDLAGAIAAVETDEALDALDDLLDLDLVRPTQVPRRFAFRHPLVRRAVYDSSRAGWRLAAHARAAELLAARGAQATERAHHVEQSARQGDEAAIELLLEAGRSASAARSGGRGSLVRGGAAPLAERRHGSAGVGAGGARLRAAVGGRARTLPQHAARGHRPAPARFRRPPGGADDPVRRRRALAGPARRGPRAADACLG